jgi:tetratricopeptide (TPR) repeat protein
MSHALDYALWGLNPLGHHLTNNILHALNTMLVVLLVMKLMQVFKKTEGDHGVSQLFFNDRTTGITATVTGLLFGLHPLHVESVAWVAERKDLLCAFFFLLTIITYTRYVSEITANEPAKFTSRFSNRKYLFTIVFFILALLSKPMAVTLPFVLLILDWYPFRRIQALRTFRTAFTEKLPFIVLTLISSLLTILAQEAGGTVRSVEDIPLSSRVIVASKSLFTYMVKIILPLHLVPFYPYPTNISLFSPEYFIPIVIVITITATCIATIRSQKLWMSVWCYYVITLMPVLGIIQVGGQSMADRYTYLPSLGPLLIIGLLAAKVYEKVSALDRWRVMLGTAGLFIGITVLISLSYAAIKQIGVWKNSIVLWNYVIAREPSRVPFAHNNLGFAYASKGQLDKAIEQYLTALRLKPDYAEVYSNLARAYASRGQLDKAIEQYLTALRLRPDYAEAHNDLGIAYSSKGRYDMAIEQYRIALRLRPDYAETHFNLGLAYASKGLLDKAIEQYLTALRLRPDLATVYNSLGVAYASQGLLDKATEQFLTALRLKPDYAKAHFNLGFIYLNKGAKDMARTQFEAGLTIEPDNFKARQALNSISQSNH